MNMCATCHVRTRTSCGLKNPLPQFYFYPDGDLQIACDRFTGDPDDLSNAPNGGFAYVRSNTETIEFYRFWYAARDREAPGAARPGRAQRHQERPLRRHQNQVPQHRALRRPVRAEPEHEQGLHHARQLYCCIGLRRKISDLNAMLQDQDWRRFMALPCKDQQFASWTVPRNCR